MCFCGFAILGILLDNLFGFTGWGYFTMEQRTALATWPADGILGVSELAFINGKFIRFSFSSASGSPSFLYAMSSGRQPLKIFYRRLFILFTDRRRSPVPALGRRYPVSLCADRFCTATVP